MAAEGLDEFIQALGAVGGLTNPVTAVAAAFTSLGSKLVPFVEAFAPGAVTAFNLAMRDTSAVIGSALLPVLNVMTNVVRTVGDALVPVAQKLAPVLGSLADTVAKVALVWVNTFANVLGQLADAVKPLLPIFEGLGSLQQAWNVVVGGVISGLTEVMLKPFGLLGDGASNLKNAFQSLAKAAVLAVGALFKLVGFDSGLKGMIAALGADVGKGASGGFAVPQNVAVQDAMSFSRDLAVRAFSAQGGGVVDKEEAWRQDVKAALSGLRADTKTSLGTLTNSVESLKDSAELIAAAVTDMARGADAVKEGSRQAGAAIGRAPDNPLTGAGQLRAGWRKITSALGGG